MTALSTLVLALNFLQAPSSGRPADWPSNTPGEAVPISKALAALGRDHTVCGRVTAIERDRNDLRAALDGPFPVPPLVVLVSADNSAGFVTESTRGLLVCLRGRVERDAGQAIVRVRRRNQFVAVEVPPPARFAPGVLAPSPGEWERRPGLAPPTLRREVKPSYTEVALNARLEGEVELKCVVEADGRVGACLIARSLDTRLGLDEAALRAARQWRFVPATQNGIPVAIVVTLVLDFNLY